MKMELKSSFLFCSLFLFAYGRKILTECQFGQDGICGGIAGLQCRPGTTCKFMGTFPDAAGKCCLDKQSTDRQKKLLSDSRCIYGQDGICGGIAGFLCRDGTTCMFMGNYPDAAGICCWDSPNHGVLLKERSKGQCPSSEGIITTCEFNPSVNCLSDGECPTGKRCCPWGCNKVCTTPV